VTELWIAIVVVAIASFAMKAAGPVLLGGRELPQPLVSVIALLAPAILAALVVVGTFSEDGRLDVDAQTAGVAVSGAAFVLRVPMIGAIALGSATAALLRL
jgi:branched-subunit amino acid transport protein